MGAQNVATGPRVTYLCARPGCERTVALGVLACAEHWRQLPPEIRHAIGRAWTVRRHHPESDGARTLHERAKARAVEWWEAA